MSARLQAVLAQPLRLEAALPQVLLRALENAGAVLVRGEGMDLAAFEAFTGRLFSRVHEPSSRFRLRLIGGDGGSTEIRAQSRLLGHAEAYYRPCLPPPDIGALLCVKAPRAAGGETFLIDGAAMFDALPLALARRLETEGIQYESLWPAPRWQAEFGVDDVHSLRRLLDVEPTCRYTLRDDQVLHLFYRAAAVRVTRRGEKAFINGLLAHLPQVGHPRYRAVETYAKASNRVHWGGGGLLDAASIDALIDAHDRHLHRHRWQAGDLLVFDNSLYLHGREALSEPDDRILYSRFGYR